MSAAVLTCRRRPRSSSSSPAGSGGVSGLRALLAGRGRGGHHLRLAEAESNYSAAAAAASEENDRFWSEEPLVLHADACLDPLGRKVLPTVVEEGGGGSAERQGAVSCLEALHEAAAAERAVGHRKLASV